MSTAMPFSRGLSVFFLFATAFAVFCVGQKGLVSTFSRFTSTYSAAHGEMCVVKVKAGWLHSLLPVPFHAYLEITSLSNGVSTMDITIKGVRSPATIRDGVLSWTLLKKTVPCQWIDTARDNFTSVGYSYTTSNCYHFASAVVQESTSEALTLSLVGLN